jgi:hypothetical protein
MTPSEQQDSRKAEFEAWAREHAPWLDLHWIPSPFEPMYATPVTRTAFAAWTASRLSAMEEAAKLCDAEVVRLTAAGETRVALAAGICAAAIRRAGLEGAP